MERAGAALAVLAVLPLLAGCVAPGDAVSDQPTLDALAVPPRALTAGTFYAFHHGGGALGLGVLPGGNAQVELFDGGDQRIGQLSLSDALAGGTLRLQNMPAGDYVIRALAVNGTLRIDSDGVAPALRPLPTHVERHVLAQAPRGTLPAAPVVPNNEPPLDKAIDLDLLRAPTAIRILVDGSFTSLDLDLRGALGPVVAAHDTGTPIFGSLGPLAGSGLSEVSATFHGENVRDGHLAGTLHTQDLRGAVVLEAASYSRAEPLAGPVAPAAGAPRFTYGTLPAQPVRFQTGPRAAHLLLHGNPFAGGDRSWVTLFDGHGRRLGTWPVATGAAIALPVAASTDYVAARIAGNATLGADAAPADFELHPLEVRESTLPAQAAGSQGDYGQAQADADATLVYAFEPVFVSPTQDPFGLDPQGAGTGCGSGTQVRVTQGNETLGAWDDGRLLPPTTDAARLLRDGPLRVLADGFGGTGCPRLAVRLRTFAV